MSCQPKRSATARLRRVDTVVPKLLPDEFILGWLKRFAVANCSTDTWRFIKSIRNERKEDAEGAASIYQTSSLVSDYTGIPNSELERLHTLLPWTQLWGSGQQGKQENNEADRRAIHVKGHRSGLCPNCVEEDRAFWGWNYWRRSHQIPGVTRCLKHEVELHFTPYLCFTTHSPYAARSIWVPVADQSIFGQQYSELAVSMLEEATPDNHDQFLVRLHALLEERSGETTILQVRNFLAAAAHRYIPDTWVHHAFVGKIDKTQMIKSLRASYPAELSSIQLAIILKLIFDEVDDALMFWRGSDGSMPGQFDQMHAGFSKA